MFEQTLSLIPSKWNDWKGMTNAPTDWLEKGDFRILSCITSPQYPPEPLSQPLPSLSPCPASAPCTQRFCGWLVFQPGIQGPYFVTSQNLNAWNDIKKLCVLINAVAEAAAVFSCCAGRSSTWHSTWDGASCSWQICLFSFFSFFFYPVCGQKIKLNCINQPC